MHAYSSNCRSEINTRTMKKVNCGDQYAISLIPYFQWTNLGCVWICYGSQFPIVFNAKSVFSNKIKENETGLLLYGFDFPF